MALRLNSSSISNIAKSVVRQAKETLRPISPSLSRPTSRGSHRSQEYEGRTNQHLIIANRDKSSVAAKSASNSVSINFTSFSRNRNLTPLICKRTSLQEKTDDRKHKFNQSIQFLCSSKSKLHQPYSTTGASCSSVTTKECGGVDQHFNKNSFAASGFHTKNESCTHNFNCFDSNIIPFIGQCNIRRNRFQPKSSYASLKSDLSTTQLSPEKFLKKRRYLPNLLVRKYPKIPFELIKRKNIPPDLLKKHIGYPKKKLHLKKFSTTSCPWMKFSNRQNESVINVLVTNTQKFFTNSPCAENISHSNLLVACRRISEPILHNHFASAPVKSKEPSRSLRQSCSEIIKTCLKPKPSEDYKRSDKHEWIYSNGKKKISLKSLYCNYVRRNNLPKYKMKLCEVPKVPLLKDCSPLKKPKKLYKPKDPQRKNCVVPTCPTAKIQPVIKKKTLPKVPRGGRVPICSTSKKEIPLKRLEKKFIAEPIKECPKPICDIKTRADSNLKVARKTLPKISVGIMPPKCEIPCTSFPLARLPKREIETPDRTICPPVPEICIRADGNLEVSRKTLPLLAKGTCPQDIDCVMKECRPLKRLEAICCQGPCCTEQWRCDTKCIKVDRDCDPPICPTVVKDPYQHKNSSVNSKRSMSTNYSDVNNGLLMRRAKQSHIDIRKRYSNSAQTSVLVKMKLPNADAEIESNCVTVGNIFYSKATPKKIKEWNKLSRNHYLTSNISRFFQKSSHKKNILYPQMKTDFFSSLASPLLYYGPDEKIIDTTDCIPVVKKETKTSAVGILTKANILKPTQEIPLMKYRKYSQVHFTNKFFNEKTLKPNENINIKIANVHQTTYMCADKDSCMKKELQPRYPAFKRFEGLSPMNPPFPLMTNENTELDGRCTKEKLTLASEVSTTSDDLKSTRKFSTTKNDMGFRSTTTKSTCSSSSSSSSASKECSDVVNTCPKASTTISSSCPEMFCPEDPSKASRKSCPKFQNPCPKLSLWQRIKNYFKAKPNCPDPKDAKRKKLVRKVQSMADQAGLAIYDPRDEPACICREVKKRCCIARQKIAKNQKKCLHTYVIMRPLANKSDSILLFTKCMPVLRNNLIQERNLCSYIFCHRSLSSWKNPFEFYGLNIRKDDDDVYNSFLGEDISDPPSEKLQHLYNLYGGLDLDCLRESLHKSLSLMQPSIENLNDIDLRIDLNQLLECSPSNLELKREILMEILRRIAKSLDAMAKKQKSNLKETA